MNYLSMFFLKLNFKSVEFISVFFFSNKIPLSGLVSCMSITPIRLELPSTANKIALSNGSSYVRRFTPN